MKRMCVSRLYVRIERGCNQQDMTQCDVIGFVRKVSSPGVTSPLVPTFAKTPDSNFSEIRLHEDPLLRDIEPLEIV